MADTNLNYTLNLKDHFRATMKGAQMETAKLDGGMGKLDKTMGRAGCALAAAFAVDRIAAFTKNVVLATAAATSFQNAILASSRSDGEGYENIRFLNKEIDQLGLNLESARGGYKTFTGAIMGTNLQGVKGNKIFRQVSEATTVLGLSAEQTEGSFLALGQMMSKGTVQAEELRGQLAERIPGAFQIGARAMGMTTKQLGEAMQKGLINSQEFLTKFGDELEKTFGGKLENATHSLQSNLNRMGTEWQRLQENIGQSQTGIINGTISWANTLLKKFNEVISGMNRVDTAFKNSGKKDKLGFTLAEDVEDFISMGNASGPKYAGKSKALALERSLKSMYVDTASRSKADSFGSEAGLLKLRSGFSKAFANKEIGSLEYERAYALIEQSLKDVRGGRTLNDVSGGAKNTENATGTGAGIGRSIGSPTEVSGARPQNITINVEKVVETINIVSETPVSGVQEAKAITSKAFLEMLNDSNTMVQ